MDEVNIHHLFVKDCYFIFLDLSIKKRARKKDINIAPIAIQKICIAWLS